MVLPSQQERYVAQYDRLVPSGFLVVGFADTFPTFQQRATDFVITGCRSRTARATYGRTRVDLLSEVLSAWFTVPPSWAPLRRGCSRALALASLRSSKLRQIAMASSARYSKDSAKTPWNFHHCGPPRATAKGALGSAVVAVVLFSLPLQS